MIQDLLSGEAPVSATATLSLAGALLGPGGYVAGALIGGAIDLVGKYSSQKKQRSQIKKKFYESLVNQYNNAIFVNALRRLGPAMEYLIELGLKPGTEEFDAALQKHLENDIGYKGNCIISLTSPGAEGQPPIKVADISSAGKVVKYSPFIKDEIGLQWAQACREIYASALRAWAVNQKTTQDAEKALQEEKEKGIRDTILRTSVNGGSLLILLGYLINQKKKLDKARSSVNN